MNGAEHFSAVVWIVSAATILAMLARPRGLSEAWWACGGALLLLALGRISPGAALTAAGAGVQVYLFLAGMMLLAELAREEGVFDWIAGAAVRRARGSCARLFLLVYLAGVGVTVLLSNDATAVVMTPAVLAAVRRARVEPRPHLLACAFVANAASFVLPISNPANLVVFGNRLPPLREWIARFGVSALAAVAATFLALRLVERAELGESIAPDDLAPALSPRGRRTLAGLLASAAALVAVSLRGGALGTATAIAGVATALLVHGRRPQGAAAAARHVSWSVLPLVAGLFVLVAALQGAGALPLSVAGLHAAARLPRIPGTFAVGCGSGLLANVMNNLPIGLMAAGAIRAAHPPLHLASAALIGVDLGPNLSVTGSLATILWLIALRREGVEVSAGRFLRIGAVVMPLALAAGLLGLG
ncbi:MAG TPA: SLC13 family permease [Opitutaceae bacterium]|jgi:arsenical pump membrane protein|nr:SLC13 family permease [Opitutaceae bacterium]